MESQRSLGGMGGSRMKLNLNKTIYKSAENYKPTYLKGSLKPKPKVNEKRRASSLHSWKKIKKQYKQKPVSFEFYV